MKMALVNTQGIVQNVVVYDPNKNWQPPEGQSLVEIEDWVNIGDQFAKEKPPEPQPKDEAQRKAERNAAYKNDLSLVASFAIEKKSNPNLSFSDFLDNLEAVVVE